VVPASTSPMFMMQPGSSSVPVFSAQSIRAGSASPLGQSLSPGGNRYVSTMIRVSPPRQRVVPDSRNGARDSILADWGSRHSSTATGLDAEPAEALLAEIAHGRMSEDAVITSQPGKEGLGEEASVLPEGDSEAGARLSAWFASGLIAAGARIGFRRLGQRRQRKVEVRPTAEESAKV
jgi:hypothetical protein